MIYFTADCHFDRGLMLTCANRPFPDVDAMNERILAGYLARITKNDETHFVGDFCHKAASRDEAAYWFDQIPGKKYLNIGNHDNQAILSLNWDGVSDISEIEAGGQTFVLCHYPMASWNNVRSGNMHLFGHLHDKFPGSKRAINVGVDHWDWGPCDAGQIMARAKTLGEHPGWEQIEPEMVLEDFLSSS